MKKLNIKQTMLFIMLLFCSFSEGQTLLHYWNFNTNTSVSAITTPSQTSISGASLSAAISGTSAINFTGGTGQNFSVLNLNTQNSDASGTHLRFDNPIGSSLVFALPTTGYENAIMKFATRRSGSGAGTQVWSYSTDGTTYTFFANVTPNDADPVLATLDFSSISAADNNPNFKLKVEFQQGGGGTAGNNRFDNFTAEGTLLSGSDITTPTVTFLPLNGASNVIASINPTISFNESVRLLNNDAITNTNIDSVVEVRLNDASGTLVPFDATFASNKITIVPTTALSASQTYYIALLANTIEDLGDNAITTLQTTTFTTAKPTVTLSVSSNSGTEVGTTLITITATADVAVNGDQTLNLGVTGTNITAGDYSLSNTVITLLSGQTSGSVTFTVVNDVLVEGSEIASLSISNPSAGIAVGSTNTQTITISDNDTALNIDLSTYVRVGRYDLPEPTRTAAPTNNLLCQEASAVTYNWDTDTLFITADGSTSITQVSKTGQLIDTMTMAQGSSPQGTDFYDTEGLTYIGNGQFVMSEERDRQLVKFTYAAGTTLSRANSQTVKIGTFVPNTGTEGLSYDPLTGGYIVLKEITPIGIFQTDVDFNAGTATNGSATTENSTNLFDPALLGFSDVADVFALSNIPALNGQSLYNNLLVLGQENAKVVNIDRSGVIVNSLTIVSDAGNPLDVASQQHEGLTMDREGNLYIVSENGGGTIDYPQLWVYAPSTVPNQAPTAIALTNTTTAILENSNTTAAIKVADITVTDDGLGINTLTLSGADANSFQITGSSLYIKPGTVIDFETKTSYNVTINVDDATIGNTPDASVNSVLDVTDVLVETTPIVSVSITEAASWSSSTTTVAADWFEVTNNGNAALDISGWKVDDSSNSFTAALALTGITSIAAGESVIFLETSATNAATIIANFKTTWFGSNVPAGLQVGSYTGTGIGLGTGGDAVNLFDSSGVVKANISFGAAATNYTFNNAASLNNSVVTTLSQVGVNDAFAAANDTVQIGSPGTVGRLFISEVAPWSSGNSPVGADWFEVTNTKAVAVDITGWKVDDNSQSPAAAVALNGITSINPGESVIFMETSDLAGKTTAFLNNWFGSNPSSDLRIGNYTGTGIGFGTGGDQVNLYNGVTSTPVTSVLFGASPTVAPFTTFDNSIGQNSLVTPISQFSAVGAKGAFIAANSITEIGSPGTIVTASCPTITATATPASSSVCVGATTTASVTATGGTTPYTVTGSSLTVGAGTYNYTITDAKGCTATTSVTINGTAVSENVTNITVCDTYTWNGTTYTTSGLYTGITTNCVTEKLNLTITPSSINTTEISACDSYTWNGITYTTSGLYTGTTTNCVTEKLNLTIVPSPKAGTSGTLNVTTGTVPTNAQLFAALTGADAGGTWTNSGLVYTYTVAAIAPCTVAATATVTVSESIPTALSFCKGATVADAVLDSSLKFYKTSAATAPVLSSTTALTSGTYYATQTVGTTVSQKTPVTITVNALPVTPLTLTSLDAKKICKYIDSDTPVLFSATPTGAYSYIWTTTISDIEESDITNDGDSAFISFKNVSKTPGAIGSVKVQIQDANGCISLPRALALTTAVPTAPTSLVMTSANSTPHFKGIITPAVEEPATPAVYGLVGLNSLVKITKVGPYMGTETVFTLTAAESPTAASYAWTLPEGVNPIGDVTGNVIDVTFDGAELKTIGALPIVVQAVGGCGSSTARTLTLARAVPSAPTKLVLTDEAIALTSTVTTKVVTKVGPYTGKSTPLTLTATPFTTQGGTATSYAWILPAGVNCETSNNPTTVKVKSTVNTGTELEPIYLIEDVAAIATASSTITINFDDVLPGVTSLPIKVFAVNGAGNSIARPLALTAAVPATPAIVGSGGNGTATQFGSCSTKTYTATLIPGATYNWTAPGGTITQTGNVIVVNYSATSVPLLGTSTVTCSATNGTGTSGIKSLNVKRIACTSTRLAPEAATTEKFSAVAYPNPSTEGFRVKSSNGKSFGVQVYDMLGRSIEQRQISSDAQIGSNYAKGVYNVIVNQGANVKTLRVIKR